MHAKRTWLFFGDFVRLYVLFHAAQSPASAVELAGRLNHRGYRLNARKLDRVLASLEQAGYLTASDKHASNGQPTLYEVTAKGRDFVVIAETRLRALAEVLLKGDVS
jgi:hypothetical protein